ncbi:hypothetical protein UA75_17450 [Actinoalloteichus sp. GBA129-24]|uniref:Uncharacterized protein n=1 Tax=Actinoalloteichus fjordicus TaxID=1612552 RepID=A0AAC9PSW0_9PSEU|nr:hypothetical protein UA74_16910 [Actinoalloteichus fjordicus]APU21480.1 hypothetical protein UA75_17450 [Actinoalloteichus sp. GBA129-24]
MAITGDASPPSTYRDGMHSPITGTAACVPFTALPPAADGPAPLVVTWHLLDAPRSNVAFVSALPPNELPAWRVHLGMSRCGARMVDGSMRECYASGGSRCVPPCARSSFHSVRSSGNLRLRKA